MLIVIYTIVVIDFNKECDLKIIKLISDNKSDVSTEFNIEIIL